MLVRNFTQLSKEETPANAISFLFIFTEFNNG